MHENRRMRPSARSIGCLEYERLARRQFLGLGPADLASVSPSLPRVALALDHSSTGDILVNVFLRGGADAINMVVPIGDPDYESQRPSIRVRASHLKPLAGTTFFGIVQGLWPLLPAYEAGHLLFVHACGSPDSSRSHFYAMEVMEFGIPDMPGVNVSTGWLTRHLQTVPPNGPLRAVALSEALPKALVGGPGALPIPSPDTFDLPGRPTSRKARCQALADLYADSPAPMNSAARETIDSLNLVKRIDAGRYRPAQGVRYPASAFGEAMRNAAAIVKSDVGVEVIDIGQGGWDTHRHQGTVDGQLHALMNDFACSLAAFHEDLLARHWHRVTVTVMSEFGRRVAENGSRGTDHGHAGLMVLMGSNVRGGGVRGQWPGLHPECCFEGLDLAATTDYRDVLLEVLEKRLDSPLGASVFPRFERGPPLNLLR